MGAERTTPSDGPLGLTHVELLDCAGISDASMSSEQKWEYSAPSLKLEVAERADRAAAERETIRAVVSLVDLALRFPGSVRSEGLPALARRWGEPDDVIALADQCAAFVARERDEPPVAPEIRAQSADRDSGHVITSDDDPDELHALDRFTMRRIDGFIVKVLGSDESPAAASKLARFLAKEARVSPAWAWLILCKWNDLKVHPIARHALAEIAKQAFEVRRVS